MTKFLIIFILVTIGQVFGQKADTLKFDRIFGCSCCADTLHDLVNKNKLYVLSDGETQLTLLKSGKQKWSINVDQLYSFGDNYIRITCMEFYKIGKRTIIQLSTDHRKQNKFYIEPKTGHQLNVSIHEKANK